MQQRLGRLDQASRRIRSFVPTVVPGLLQLPDYVRAIGSRDLHGDDLDRFVAARTERQATLDTDREFVIIVTEGVIALARRRPKPHGGAATAHGEPAPLRRPNLHLGVMPWTRPVRAPALHCFDVYDARAVVIGTETATAIITDPRDVSDYAHRFESYAADAVFDDDARAVLTRVADEYRALRIDG